MPKSIDNEIVTSLLTDIRASGEKDKAALRKESKVLQEKLVDATETILDLSIAKKGLEKDVQFFRDTKLSRETGAAVLAICGVAAPLFPIEWWSVKLFSMVYGGVVFGAIISVGLGIFYGRKRMDT